ncbi:MAG: exodeoxyribonuclease VII large subunit [Rhodospirillaceae bacterium]|nr:exodeoxyribonuclease VII large subunit [Rhodospirillaceae bacterium]
MNDNIVSNKAEYSVSELSTALKRTVESSYGYVRVRGEISGLKRAASGHIYMTLKDDNAVISGVCWRGVVSRLNAKPEDGLEIIATGKVTTYAQQSKYQIVVEQIEVAGEGALLKLLENRRKKLAQEGLFDKEKKQPLPFLPNRIGVITSPTGAVIRDILHRIDDRFPRDILLWPVLVQGGKAAKQIADAINGFNALNHDGQLSPIDLLIVARGGGSLEDMWPFNEEVVVRAASESKIPLISAVGHETDTTLLDYAADQRAPTPTAAAEIAVPVRNELKVTVMNLGRRHLSAMIRKSNENRILLEGFCRGLPDLKMLLAGHNQRLDIAIERLEQGSIRLVKRLQESLSSLGRHNKPPQQIIDNDTKRLSRETEMLRQAGCHLIQQRVQKLKASGELLESVSFKSIIDRGYTVIWDRNGSPITSASAAIAGMQVVVEFADGKKNAVINDSLQNKEKRPSVSPDPNENQGELL